jgi:hypothetical protein
VGEEHLELVQDPEDSEVETEVDLDLEADAADSTANFLQFSYT